MVLFLHVTTRLDGRPYDDLLLRKGQMGFPSFVVMDADGELLANVGPPTLEGFQKASDEAVEFATIATAAEGGDAAARKSVFLRRLEWLALPFAAAKAEFETLELTESERKAGASSLQMLEILDARLTTDRKEGLAKLLRIRSEGRLLDDPQIANTYWRYLQAGAEQLGDAVAYAVYVEYLRGMVEKQPRMKATLEQAEKKLTSMQKD